MKFPTYDDETIDNELRFEITLDTLYSDIHSSNSLLEEFEKAYEDIIIKDNKGAILQLFAENNLNYLTFKLDAIILRRHLVLISYLIKLRFEDHKDEQIIKLLEKDYDIDDSQIINTLFVASVTFNGKIVEISAEQENELLEFIKKNLENERCIKKTTLRNHSPSITGLSLTLKMLKSLIVKISESLEEVKTNSKEANLILFFHSVSHITFKLI